MRLALALLLLVSLAARTVTDAEVDKVHQEALLVDTHNDVPMKVLKGYDLGTPSPGGSTDIARLKAGNVGAVFFAAYVPAKYARQKTAAAYCRNVIDGIRQGIVGKHPETFLLARTTGDIAAARKQGKIAALIGIEGGHAIEDSTQLLQEFYNLGARYMTRTHSNTNNWADSSGDKPRHGGLNDLGRSIVGEMNRLGMMVDISHVSDETFWDVLETSKAPVFASHSSCRAIAKSKRNMTDAMMRAMAKKGGVIQINFGCDFLNEAVRTERPTVKTAVRRKFADDMDGARAAMEKQFKRATLADVVAHIDHAVKVAGIDHVGIGSDFDGIDCTPVGLEDNGRFRNLTRALLEKGYTAPQIRKIYGENTLRLLGAVEAVARGN